jgi:hypothetical protein
MRGLFVNKIVLIFCFTFFPRVSWAQDGGFVAYSPKGYYSSIVNHLRNPMVKNGVIIGKNFERKDTSLFSDAFYADILAVAKGPDGYLSGGTTGVTWQFKYGYIYGLVSGYSYWKTHDSQGYGLVGGGIRKKIWKLFDLNIYGQISYGAITINGENHTHWEVGGYPLNHKWLQSSLHALGEKSQITWFETRNRVGFLGIHFWEDTDLDIRRTAFSISRRSLAIIGGSKNSSTWEAELQLATIDLPKSKNRIWESRLKLFVSTVGGGPKGEARPGIHLNLSYVSENQSDYKGFGVEIGFGAKQLDAHQSQELYFVIFYNYSAWFYRQPSLKYGIGLAGRI